VSGQPASAVVCGATDLGLVRKGNEDAYVVSDVSTGTVLTPTEPTAVPLSSDGVLLAVCDGMGGAAAGEVASRLASDALARALHDCRKVDLRASGASALDLAVRVANRAVFAESIRRVDRRGMGTTCTAALLLADRVVLAQVGDSRAYLFRDGELLRLTRDQSLAMAMIDSGTLSAADVKDFPDENVILQAVGVQPRIDPVISEIDVRPGDRILLCSDGLHGPVSEAQIRAVLRRIHHLGACVRTLVHAALEAGGPDNITAVLASVEPPPQ